jgi:hypothetical protein
MLGYQWGYWTYPYYYGNLHHLPYRFFNQGTCANFGILDLKLLDDEELTENVIYSIYADPRIPKTDKDNIKVESRMFKISLSGEVKRRSSKFFAYTDTLQTPGVRDINNEIRIV